MNKITIIVPIYNVEKYLRTCFDSLLNQTFDKYEILAVSDGSKDGSNEIMKEYSKKYPDKIKCIFKENGGYGSVLELAISKIETPYFQICDPDDYLDPEALKHLYDLAQLSDADITIGAKYFIYEGTEDKDYDYAYNTNYTKLKTNTVYNNGTSEYDDLLFVDPSPHSKLYKREVAKDIKFLYNVSYTDNLLFYLSYLNAKKIIYTDKACAYYLIDRAGNTMTDVRPKAIDGHVKVFNEILDQHDKSKASDMFYYRMFESFKYIVEQSKRIDAPLEEASKTIDNLYTLVERLIPYKDKIKPYYDKYSKSKFIEKIKDKRLLDEKSSKSQFRKLKKSLLSKFEE